MRYCLTARAFVGPLFAPQRNETVKRVSLAGRGFR